MMDQAALSTILDDAYADAQSYYQVQTESDRQRALDYYLRLPRGDERRGRSRVVAAEVFKTVEGISTAITNIFLSERLPVEFEPRKEDDVEKARLRSEAVNYYAMHKAGGFNAAMACVKDGVLQDAGYLTWRWEKKKIISQESYNNQNEDALALLLDNDAVTLISQEPTEPHVYTDEETGKEVAEPLFNVVVRFSREVGEAVIEAIPPEEILVSPKTRGHDLQKSPVVIWRTLKTRDELLQEGHDLDLVDSIGFNGSQMEDGVTRNSEYASNSLESCELQTFWLYVDEDEDGYYEFRKIVRVDDVILSDEITDELNIASWCPTPMPHEFYGRCPAYESIETQDIQTALWRQNLDGIYASTNPMWRTSSATVLQQLLKPEIGRPFQAAKDDLEVITLPFVGQHIFPMMEFVQADNENKTGFTRYAQGMDAKSLNDTATGIKIITNMSQERTKKMARLFAQCWAQVMRGISKLLSQNCDKEMQMRLSGNYVTVDPREWAEEYDMAVKVGLGIKDQQEKIQGAMAVNQVQMGLLQASGGMLVSPQNLYEGALESLNALGVVNPQKMLTNPETIPPAPPQQPPDPMQSPDVIKAQIAAQSSGQATAYKVDKEAEIEIYKADKEAQSKMQLEIVSQQAEIAKNQALSQTQAITHVETVQPVIEAMQMQLAQNAQNLEAIMAQGFGALGEAMQMLAQVQAQQVENQSRPMTARLSNGKTITMGIQ